LLAQLEKPRIKWLTKLEGNPTKTQALLRVKPSLTTPAALSHKIRPKKMIMPAMLAVASPVIVGLVLGKYALGAMLLGGLATSVPQSPFFTFSGGIWDNAKNALKESSGWRDANS
jgi:Na+/H+-translocating membrane pyrophosphatase